jgi:hypothetical protein
LLLPLPAAAVEWPDLSAPAQGPRDGERDAALLVGIEDHVYLPPVPGADDNVNDWRRYLAGRGVPLANIKVLLSRDAAREAILTEAAVARDRVGEGGTLWVVFVGHGAPSADGRDGLLVGADANRTAVSLAARSVTRTELLDLLASGRQARTVAVIDACFSGRSGSGVADSLAPGLQPVIPTALAPVDRATLLSAGAADQFAGPLPGAERPAFSYLVLGALRGWGDANADGAVTAREAAAYAEGALSALVTDRRQTPQVEGPHADAPLSRSGEAGPDLLALAERLAAGPVAPSVSAGGTASDRDLSELEARIRDQECQRAADAEAIRARDAELSRAARAEEAALADAWAALRDTARRAAQVDDPAVRRDAQAEVRRFVDEVRGRTVSSTPGEHRASTPCGPRVGLAPGTSVEIGEEVHAEAAALLAAYDGQGRLPDPSAGPRRSPSGGGADAITGLVGVGGFASLATTAAAGQPVGGGLAVHGLMLSEDHVAIGLDAIAGAASAPVYDLGLRVGPGFQVGPVALAAMIGFAVDDPGPAWAASARVPLTLSASLHTPAVALELSGGYATATGGERAAPQGPIDELMWSAAAYLGRPGAGEDRSVGFWAGAGGRQIAGDWLTSFQLGMGVR